MLKLDPKNTELLNQKQVILNKEIEETRNKLTILKEVKEEADKKMSEGTKINEENYRALQREIINTESKLKNLQLIKDPFYQFGKNAEELGNKINNVSSKIDSLGNKLTVGVTVPVVAGFTAMTKSAIENETAVQQVEKIYGDAAESIKDFAENKALDYNMSANEAYKYSQIYGNLIQSITDDQAENAAKTQELLQASSVIASATGRTMEDVMDRIRSGLLGNTEAIEDLGVNVNVALLETTDAFKQIAGDRSWEKLSFQEQQQIRLLGILEQTSKKYGKEVNKNTSSSIQQLTAKTKNLTNNLGKKLLPVANKIIDKADDLVDKFGDLSEEEQENIIKIGLMVAAAGPLIKITGTLGKGIGTVTKGIGLFSQAVGVAANKTTSTVPAVNNLAKVLSGLTSPAGLAALGITAAVTTIVTQIKKAEEETKEKFSTMGQAASDFYNGIQTAEGYLDTFNTTLFASTEEQENLQKQMDEIQSGITEICKTASDERRGYTQEEITQLDEYFEKLRELEQQQLEISQSQAEAITQIAKTESESFQGSLEEYGVYAQQYIATARQKADETIAIAQQNKINTIGLLNSQYSEEERIDNEEYQRKLKQANADYEAAVNAANKQVGDVSAIYAEGYAQRANQDGAFAEHIKHYNWEQEQENLRYSQKMQEIEENKGFHITNQQNRFINAANEHMDKQKEIWENMYNNMSESEVEQLGSWLVMLANAEMYGREISEENQEMVDTILDTFQHMPPETRKAMKNAMSPMLEEMESSQPTLFAKASGIADGILSRLKKSFDIHSPSRETRDIFQNVMKGAELGLDDEQKKLMSEVDKIAESMKLKLANINPNMGAIKQSVIDQTKTVFVTPNLIINAQDELTPAKMNSIIDTVNRRLGSRY